MIVPLSQVQHVHDMAWLAILGTIGMMLAVLVVVGKLGWMYVGSPRTVAPTEWVTSGSFSSALVGVMVSCPRMLHRGPPVKAADPFCRLLVAPTESKTLIDGFATKAEDEVPIWYRSSP